MLQFYGPTFHVKNGVLSTKVGILVRDVSAVQRIGLGMSGRVPHVKKLVRKLFSIFFNNLKKKK